MDSNPTVAGEERRSILDPHYSVLELLNSDLNAGRDRLMAESWQILSSSSETSDEEVELNSVGGSTNVRPNSVVTSGSFIMPKLSLSGELIFMDKILVVGTQSSIFYQHLLPFSFRQHFTLAIDHRNSVEKRIYKKFLIAVSNEVELHKFLNVIFVESRYSEYNPSVIILMVLKKKDAKMIKNCTKLLNQFKVNYSCFNLIYPLTVVILDKHRNKVTNQPTLNDLLLFIRQSLLSDSKAFSKKKSINKKRRRKLLPNSKNSKSVKSLKISTKWLLIWGISLTVGVGVGYFISCFISYKEPLILSETIDDQIQLTDIQQQTEQHQEMSATRFWSLFKHTAKNVYRIMKSLIKNPVCLSYKDDPQNQSKILAMSFVLL